MEKKKQPQQEQLTFERLKEKGIFGSPSPKKNFQSGKWGLTPFTGKSKVSQGRSNNGKKESFGA